jgi:hypothetical protein
MAEPPSDARRYAYEMRADPAAERGREFVFRPEPLTVGDRLTTGVLMSITGRS